MIDAPPALREEHVDPVTGRQATADGTGGVDGDAHARADRRGGARPEHPLADDLALTDGDPGDASDDRLQAGRARTIVARKNGALIVTASLRKSSLDTRSPARISCAATTTRADRRARGTWPSKDRTMPTSPATTMPTTCPRGTRPVMPRPAPSLPRDRRARPDGGRRSRARRAGPGDRTGRRGGSWASMQQPPGRESEEIVRGTRRPRTSMHLRGYRSTVAYRTRVGRVRV